MPMLYCRASDLVGAGATIAAAAGTVSADPHYGLAAAHDENPACPLKFTDAPAAFVRIVWDFGAPQRIDGLALVHHNLDAGLAVRVMGHSANDWAAPTITAPLTILARLPGGTPGHSRNPWADLRSLAGYTALGLRYWALDLGTVASPNSIAPQIGQVCLVSQWRSLQRSVLASLDMGVGRMRIDSIEGSFGTATRYPINVRQASYRLPVLPSEADYQDLQDLWDDSQGVRPFVCVLDGQVQTDGGYLMEFTDDTVRDLRRSWAGGAGWPTSLSVIELSRGLPL